MPSAAPAPSSTRIRCARSAELMRWAMTTSVPGRAANAALDAGLGRRVEVARRLVEQDEARRRDVRPHERDELALARRQLARDDRRVVAADARRRAPRAPSSDDGGVELARSSPAGAGRRGSRAASRRRRRPPGGSARGGSPRSRGSRSAIRTSPRRTSPDCGTSIPATSPASVDLPTPLGPTTARWSPSSIDEVEPADDRLRRAAVAERHVAAGGRRDGAARATARPRAGCPAASGSRRDLDDPPERHEQPQARVAEPAHERLQRRMHALRDVGQRAEDLAGAGPVSQQPRPGGEDQHERQPAAERRRRSCAPR